MCIWQVTRAIHDKSETRWPKVSLEAKMLSCAIDAKESRYIAVTNIPGVFIHLDMNKEVHMLLEGTIAKIIIKFKPKLYRKYIWKNKHDKPMLYVRLKKALYGTLQAV